MTEIETDDRELACRLPDEEQDRQWEDVKRFVREQLRERVG